MDSRLLMLTLALLTFALAGCSDDGDNGDAGDATTGTGMTSGMPTSGAPGNGTNPPTPVDNSTIEERTCTATVGGPGAGYVGDPSGTAYIGGCPFGTLESAAVLYDVQLPAECEPYQVAPGGGSTDAQPAAEGSQYPSGTRLMMFCGPGGPNLVGTIQLLPA